MKGWRSYKNREMTQSHLKKLIKLMKDDVIIL